MLTKNCKETVSSNCEVMFKNKMYHFFSEHSVVYIHNHVQIINIKVYLVKTTRQADGSVEHRLTPADDCRQCPSAGLSVSVMQAPAHQRPSHRGFLLTSTPHITANNCNLLGGKHSHFKLKSLTQQIIY